MECDRTPLQICGAAAGYCLIVRRVDLLHDLTVDGTNVNAYWAVDGAMLALLSERSSSGDAIANGRHSWTGEQSASARRRWLLKQRLKLDSRYGSPISGI